MSQLNTNDFFDFEQQMERENQFGELENMQRATSLLNSRNTLYSGFNFNSSLNDSQSSFDMSSSSDLSMRRRSIGSFQNQSQYYSTPIKQPQMDTSQISQINQAYLNLFARQNRSNSIASPFANLDMTQANTLAALNIQKNKNRRMSLFNTPSACIQKPIQTQQQSNIWDRIRQKNLMGNANKSMQSSLFLERNETHSRQLFDIGERQLSSFEEKVACTGNIFVRREDWDILKELPTDKQNAIHVRLEDEGPYGNDETRCFVLSHLSSLGIRDIDCLLCAALLQQPPESLSIYDRFPLINGTLFLSPVKYNAKLSKYIKALVSNKDQYIYAVCLKCLNHWSNESSCKEGDHKKNDNEGDNRSIECKYCKTKWRSESLQIGTLYKYDILSAYPCCNARLTCNKCKTQLCDLNINPLPYFSSYSDEIECYNCKTKDNHFIKPIDEIFSVH